jgi:hypothetical protein
MIIGSITGIAILVWFYNTAPSFGRNPLHWGVAGFVVYFTVALIWTYFVTPGIKDAAMHSRSTFLMYVVRYAYIILAAAVAIIFNKKIGPKNRID